MPPKKNQAVLFYIIILVLFLFNSACRKEVVPEQYKPTRAHEAYIFSLEQAGLAETALGKDWIFASKTALKNPNPVSLPFAEVFYVDSSSAFAVGYSFEVKKGQRIDVEVSIQNQNSFQFVFLH